MATKSTAFIVLFNSTFVYMLASRCSFCASVPSVAYDQMVNGEVLCSLSLMRSRVP